MSALGKKEDKFLSDFFVFSSRLLPFGREPGQQSVKSIRCKDPLVLHQDQMPLHGRLKEIWKKSKTTILQLSTQRRLKSCFLVGGHFECVRATAPRAKARLILNGLRHD